MPGGVQVLFWLLKAWGAVWFHTEAFMAHTQRRGSAPRGVLLSCLSSGRGERSWRAVERALAEHGVQHVDPPPGEAQDGLVVPLALGTLTVVIGPRGGMSQAGESRQEERVLEPMVAESTRPVGIDGRARFPGRRPQTGVRGQVSRRPEAADRADLDRDTRPEASSNAWQATQDRRLGQGEKIGLDLFLQFRSTHP